MKKITLGPQTLVYPMPAFLIGANVGGKANFMTAAWSGIACSTPPMITVALQHHRHTLKGIKETGVFSVNVPGSDQVKETDFCGIYSGTKEDKAEVCGFSVFYGKLGKGAAHRRMPRKRGMQGRPSASPGQPHAGDRPDRGGARIRGVYEQRSSRSAQNRPPHVHYWSRQVLFQAGRGGGAGIQDRSRSEEDEIKPIAAKSKTEIGSFQGDRQGLRAGGYEELSQGIVVQRPGADGICEYYAAGRAVPPGERTYRRACCFAMQCT